MHRSRRRSKNPARPSSDEPVPALALVALPLLLLIAAAVPVASPAPGSALPRFGFGRPATEAEIAAWDLDVRPDGVGLPPGRGTVTAGAVLYAERCASCHGATGVEGPNTRLAGRLPGDEFPFATDTKARKTIGNYWPFATTLFDYTRRAMPANAPGSLTDEEVYSLTAFLLHLNDLLPADGQLDARSLPAIRMPARDRFVPDDRRGGPEVR